MCLPLSQLSIVPTGSAKHMGPRDHPPPTRTTNKTSLERSFAVSKIQQTETYSGCRKGVLCSTLFRSSRITLLCDPGPVPVSPAENERI